MGDMASHGGFAYGTKVAAAVRRNRRVPPINRQHQKEYDVPTRKNNQDQGGREGQRRDSQQAVKGRGFAGMDPEQQREIASEGGRAAHASGHAHEFTSEEARAAGRKGGEARSHASRSAALAAQAAGTRSGRIPSETRSSQMDRDIQGGDNRGGRGGSGS